MSEQTDQQDEDEVRDTDQQTSETSVTPSKLISKKTISKYLQLSKRRVVAIWIGTIVINASILVAIYSFFGTKVLMVSFSILAILLGFIGTITTLLPSVLTELGETKSVRDMKEFNESMLSADEQLEEGKQLQEGSDEFESLASLILEATDSIDEINSITPIVDEKSDYSYRLKINNIPTGVSDDTISTVMKTYMDKVEEEGEYFQDIQERRYVVLGGSIYGIAILLQAVSTIITKLPL